MGMLECDDGNFNDGDGCSSECKIEKGYICTRQGTAADICRDVTPPEVSIKILKENRIAISFNEPVSSIYSSISSMGLM